MEVATRTIRWLEPTIRIAALLGLFPAGTPKALAYDVYARGHVGLYRAQERFAEPSADSNSNDSQALLGSLYVNARTDRPFAHEIVLDARDRYDSYGTVDPTYPRLIESHAPELRQLAIKSRDASDDRFVWSAGRFTLPEAAMTANDGGELGLRLNPRLVVGGFGGLYPERRRGHAMPISDEAPQAGAYAAYQERGNDWGKHTYAATSLVMRQETEEVSAFAATPDPTTGETEEAETVSRVYWYSNAVYQPRPSMRLTGLSHVDISPGTHVRNLWLSGFNQINPRWSATLSLLRLDLTEYERRRELRDALPPSTFTQVRGTAKQRLSKTLMAELNLANGIRGVDSRSKAEIYARGLMTGLARGRLSAHAGGGFRKNFTSRDTFVKAGASAYFPKFEMSLTQQLGIESLETGETLHPMITDVTGSFMASKSVFVALTGEYARDERVTIMSGILTAGFRFGERQLTPTRDAAPGLERL